MAATYFQGLDRYNETKTAFAPISLPSYPAFPALVNDPQAWCPPNGRCPPVRLSPDQQMIMSNAYPFTPLQSTVTTQENLNFVRGGYSGCDVTVRDACKVGKMAMRNAYN